MNINLDTSSNMPRGIPSETNINAADIVSPNITHQQVGLVLFADSTNRKESHDTESSQGNSTGNGAASSGHAIAMDQVLSSSNSVDLTSCGELHPCMPDMNVGRNFTASASQSTGIPISTSQNRDSDRLSSSSIHTSSWKHVPSDLISSSSSPVVKARRSSFWKRTLSDKSSDTGCSTRIGEKDNPQEHPTDSSDPQQELLSYCVTAYGVHDSSADYCYVSPSSSTSVQSSSFYSASCSSESLTERSTTPPSNSINILSSAPSSEFLLFSTDYASTQRIDSFGNPDTLVSPGGTNPLLHENVRRAGSSSTSTSSIDMRIFDDSEDSRSRSQSMDSDPRKSRSRFPSSLPPSDPIYSSSCPSIVTSNSDSEIRAITSSSGSSPNSSWTALADISECDTQSDQTFTAKDKDRSHYPPPHQHAREPASFTGSTSALANTSDFISSSGDLLLPSTRSYHAAPLFNPGVSRHTFAPPKRSRTVRNNPVVSSSDSAIPVRRSARTGRWPTNLTPLGPCDLEYDYHMAYQDLRTATIRAVYALGYKPPTRFELASRSTSGDSVLTEDSLNTRPTLEMILSAKFPDVERARRRVNEADRRLQEALDRGHTWKNTPIPTSQLTKFSISQHVSSLNSESELSPLPLFYPGDSTTTDSPDADTLNWWNRPDLGIPSAPSSNSLGSIFRKAGVNVNDWSNTPNGPESCSRMGGVTGISLSPTEKTRGVKRSHDDLDTQGELSRKRQKVTDLDVVNVL